jgi:starch synthase
MKVLMLTREYPPHVYGGAGVHVEHLVRSLTRMRGMEVEVRCIGDQAELESNPRVLGFPYGGESPPENSEPAAGALRALQTNLDWTARPLSADVAHCHTWYSHWGGILARLAYGIPLVVTVHSLEPLRPWKREQLGRGYDLSMWIERQTLTLADAVIAVSSREKEGLLELLSLSPDRVTVVPNGIDTEVYRPVTGGQTASRYSIDPERPFVLYLGRIARQKGIGHFLRAAAYLPPEAQVVLCAASPDTPELGQEVARAVVRLQEQRRGVVWIREMLSRQETVELYSQAAVFCCPSIYEPFGIINLEAMACQTPVVASAVGGIPDVVVHGQTGLLVEVEPGGPDDPEPAHPEEFARRLAAGISELLADPERRARMGRRGRERVRSEFDWQRIAGRTREVYREAIAHAGSGAEGR